MTNKPTATPDGITRIDEHEGKYYIGFSYINQKIEPKGYSLQFITTTEKFKLIQGEKTLIDLVPTILVHGRDSVEYEYYVNTILPLLK